MPSTHSRKGSRVPSSFLKSTHSKNTTSAAGYNSVVSTRQGTTQQSSLTFQKL